MSETTKHRPLVFSGIQPTGKLHLGNYLGAMKNWVRLQDSMSCIYCVVDMHAITIWQDPSELVASTREVAAACLAVGIDPERSILFNQSQVAEHAELAWVFNCVARIGWLNRMTQFKDKAGKNRENASVGLFVYPDLMAADILAYRATHVPVGEDQKQHLELARDIAQKFNVDFSAPDFFPLPEPFITGPGTRVMSLRDGTRKMSKSEESDFSRINLSDEADIIAQKIRKARTDPRPMPGSKEEMANRPEAENLINIYAGLSDQKPEAVLTEYAGAQFSTFKNALADLAVAKLMPIGAAMKRYLSDWGELDRVLASGAARARAIAAPVMREVRQLVGFVG